MKESGRLMDRTRQMVVESLRTSKGHITDWQFLRRNIEEKVAKFLYKETGRRPLIVPVIVEV